MFKLEEMADVRLLAPGQRSELAVYDIQSDTETVIFSAEALIEAPNWTPDGRDLIFNGGGRLWRISIGGGEPVAIDSGAIANFNNDHVISADGRFIYASANDGHIYRLDIGGGEPVLISNHHEKPFLYFLHGISPDGAELAYVGVEPLEEGFRANLFTIPAGGGADRRLTDEVRPHDGPEYSPDGQWVYFNCEPADAAPGHAQLFRMDRNGGAIEQLTVDSRVNWFPHLAPSASLLVYISYPEGTTGHPADRAVILKLMSLPGLESRDLARFNGGQGTINVNSWAPDSQRFAYVKYPLS